MVSDTHSHTLTIRFDQYPTVPVVINHMGCMKLDGAADDIKKISFWRSALTDLAAVGPHVHIKLSAFVFMSKQWHAEGSPVIGLVKELIAIFGPNRFLLYTCCTSRPLIPVPPIIF